jgi:predicted metal-dependent phosphoesterase TrpH
LVRRAGGLPVLAHPYIYSRNGEKKADMDLKHWLPRLQRAGLAGIEVYYPNYPRRVRRRLLELAAGRGLAVTGGSDFHGGPVGSGLGRVVVPWAAWESLERRHQLMRAGST